MALKWSGYTCPAGTVIAGILDCNASRDTIKAVDRSPDTTVLATADTQGLVKLFKYPCPVEYSSHMVYRGHSAVVSNARFTPDGKYLISIGATDKSVFQWKYTRDHEAEFEPSDAPIKPTEPPRIDLPLEMDTRKDEGLKLVQFPFFAAAPPPPPQKVEEEKKATADNKAPSSSPAPASVPPPAISVPGLEKKDGGPTALSEIRSHVSEGDFGEGGKKKRLISDIAHSQPKSFQLSKSSVIYISFHTQYI